jgi:hypothetical protein
MEKAAAQIRKRFETATDLPFRQQFHFYSRWFLWSRDQTAATWLEGVHEQVVGTSAAQFRKRLAAQASRLGIVPTAAQELRREAYQAYPHVRAYSFLLYETLMVYIVYGVDRRSEIAQLLDVDELHRYTKHLLHDPERLRALSTYGLNMLYIAAYFYEEKALPLEYLAHMATPKTAARYTPDALRLALYTLAHCVIGESMFYYRSVSPTVLPMYQSMVQQAGQLLEQRYADVSLDNKLETLVCARICRVALSTEQNINDEALHSFDPQRGYITDTQNVFHTKPNTLKRAEHRNVLFLLGNQTYNPRK